MKTYTEVEVADCRTVTRQGEIIAWCEAHRPDIVSEVKAIFNSTSPESRAIQFLIGVSFAAGREFQSLNNHISINQPI